MKKRFFTPQMKTMFNKILAKHRSSPIMKKNNLILTGSLMLFFLLFNAESSFSQNCTGCPVGFTGSIAGTTLTAMGSHDGDGTGCNNGGGFLIGLCGAFNCPDCTLSSGVTTPFSMDLDIFCVATGLSVYFEETPLDYTGQTGCEFGIRPFVPINVDLTSIGLCAGASYTYRLREYSCENGYDSGENI